MTRTSPATRTEAPGRNPLRVFAEKAKVDGDGWYGVKFWRSLIDEDDGPLLDEPDAEFLAAATPGTVLRLFDQIDGPAPTLDEAWRAVEAVLPAEATLGVTSTSGVQSGRYVATTDHGSPINGYAYGDSPAAALQALRDKLVAG